MSSRLTELDHRFRPYAVLLLQWLQQVDPYYRVTSTRRSVREQTDLYANFQAGKSAFTVAPPGCSKHQLGLAFDVMSTKRDPFSDPYLNRLGNWWRSVGGEWGGEKDPIHFGWPGKIC